MITPDIFREAVGRDPEQDDLERCNCATPGKTGHYFCGWDEEANLPVFMVDPAMRVAAARNRCDTIVTKEREKWGRPRNYYEPPYIAMITSGQVWRCPHGTTRFMARGCWRCGLRRPIEFFRHRFGK
jgi:hypothetical protein